MNNNNALSFYDKLSQNIKSPLDTRNKAKDFSYYDHKLVKKFSNKNYSLLDLGSGTGLLINSLINDFKYIIAVEKYPEFSKFITNNHNLMVINMDLLNIYNLRGTFNIISLFGVMNYFNYEEAKLIYSHILELMDDTSTLIIKNQMGVNEDVTINGFSQELGTNYYSNYRYLQNEIDLLVSLGFKVKEVIDIYPPEFNRWDNTKFYALICSKN